MLKAAHHLALPIVTTTQNRARLGATVAELAPFLTEPRHAYDEDKTRFSMWTPGVAAAFARLTAGAGAEESSGKGTVVLVGIEAHICITQTALDVLAAGHAVYVLADGVSSCNAGEAAVALARMCAAGAVITTSESWLYECMGDAAIPEFRAVAALVKESAADTRAAVSALLSKM